MPGQASVTVEQRTSFEDYEPDGQPKYTYRVVQTRNTIIVRIGQELSADRVEGLIEVGVDVTVKRPT